MPGCSLQRSDCHDSQGRVFSAGNNRFGELGRSSGDSSKLQRIMNVPLMLAASCGLHHTISLDESGGVWTWGFGQLGTGDTAAHLFQPTPILSLRGASALVAGRRHSFAFSQEGGLLVLGQNDYGQLGLDHTTDQLTPMLSPFQPAVPPSFTRSRKKSARFL